MRAYTLSLYSVRERERARAREREFIRTYSVTAGPGYPALCRERSERGEGAEARHVFTLSRYGKVEGDCEAPV